MVSKTKPSSATSREPDRKLTIEELDRLLGGRMPFKIKKPPSKTPLKLFSTPLDHQQPSESINNSLIEDDALASKVKTRKDATHVLDNLFDCDPEDEEDSAFVEAFLELTSIDGVDGQMTLSSDNLHALYSYLSKDFKNM